jgi:hypothetical protein
MRNGAQRRTATTVRRTSWRILHPLKLGKSSLSTKRFTCGLRNTLGKKYATVCGLYMRTIAWHSAGSTSESKEMVTSQLPRRRGARAVTWPGVLLILLLLVVPAGQLLSGLPGAALWEELIFGIDAIAIFLVCVVPWLDARWARKLLREITGVSPASTVTMVTWWPANDPEPQRGVLRADSVGVTLHNSSSLAAEVLWQDVVRVEVIQRGRLARESIHVTTPPGLADLRFLPMGRQGIGQANSLRVHECAKQLSAYASQRAH